MTRVEELTRICKGLTEEHIIKACEKYHDELTKMESGVSNFIKYNKEYYKLNPTIRYANQFNKSDVEINPSDFCNTFTPYFQKYFENDKLKYFYLDIRSIYEYIKSNEKEIKRQIQNEYKDFLKEKYKNQYEKDSSLLSDPFHAYQFENRDLYNKYNVDFWKILENNENLENYRTALISFFKEKEEERGEPFPPNHASSYFSKFKKFKEFFDTKYGGYFDWLKTFEHIAGSEEQTTKGKKMTDKNKKTDPIPLNQILYGPPGTGKTYRIKSLVEEIVGGQTKNNIIINVTDLNWYSVIALGMYKKDPGKYFTITELKKLPEIQMFYESKNNNSFLPTLRNNLQVHTSPESTTVKIENRQKPYLFDKDENKNDDNKTLWFLTDEGKKYIENNLSEYLNDEDLETNNKEIDNFVEFITFHQSYSYEEFIEGIRPKMNNENKELSYEYNKGIFKEMCLRANSDPYNKYVIVIDEINRGNISKIFGELITLIEKDKRIKPNGEYSFENIKPEGSQLLVKLPYTNNKFGVPDNLYIIGTMNTADKSLAMLDVALRRRFDFKPMYPQYDKTQDGKTIYHSDFLKVLNKKILKEKNYNADYLIGHSYFMSNDGEPKLVNILNKNVIPLLMEYFNGKIIEVQDILKSVFDECKIDYIDFDKSYSIDNGELYYLQVEYVK